MTAVAHAMNALFDQLTAPFGGAPALAVAVISAFTGVLMLLLFKWSTNQEQLAAARQVLTGRVYEMGLYQDHLSVLGKIQRDLAVANFKYLRWSLPSLLVILPLMIIIFTQLDARYGHRPFLAGESSLVTVEVAEGHAGLLNQLRLTASPGVVVESRPLVDQPRRLVRWRVRVEDPGDHQLSVGWPSGQSVTKTLAAGTSAPLLAQVREKESLLRFLFNPAEAPLPAESPLETIALDLPARKLDYGLFQTSWLVALVIFSLAAGLAFKDLFHVRF